MSDNINHEQSATLPTEARESVTVVALLSLKAVRVAAELKRERAALKLRMEDIEAWNVAGGMADEMANATAQTRREIAALKKQARKEAAKTDEARNVAGLSVQARGIKERIAAELSGCAQMLLPFMRIVE